MYVYMYVWIVEARDLLLYLSYRPIMITIYCDILFSPFELCPTVVSFSYGGVWVGVGQIRRVAWWRACGALGRAGIHHSNQS